MFAFVDTWISQAKSFKDKLQFCSGKRQIEED